MLKWNLQLFGGRGAGSGGGGLPTLKPSGGGSGSGGGQFSNGVGLQNIDTLKEAIGKKGQAMSIQRAVEGANPYFDRTGTYKEFTENCQRCVVAYEARRRGYNVVAQPTYEGDILPQANVAGKGQARWQGAFQGAKSEKVGAKTADKALANVEAKMKEYGNGSRAVLGVQWKNGGGHVLNVENKNGKTLFVDAQVGGKYTAKDLFKAIKPSEVRLVRTDNLKFSDRAKKSIEQSGRRD